MIDVDACVCRECAGRRWLVERIKEFKAEQLAQGHPRFDWDDLEQQSRANRERERAKTEELRHAK